MSERIRRTKPPADPAPPSTDAAARRRAWIFLAILLTIFMGAVEATIVATALPTIIGDLGGFQLYSWVFAAYLLPQAVTTPIYGKLADLFGRKRVLLFGIGLFLVGSVLSGLAGSMAALIAFRVLQGIGAGALQPIAMTITGDLYPGAERAKVQGYLSSVWAVSAVVGPLVGAALTRYLGWPMVFWVNLPVGVAAAAILLAMFHEEVQRRRHRIDYLGSALMTVGTGLVMVALTQAASFGALLLAACAAGAVVALALLLVHERRAAEPILPLALWTQRIIAGGNLASFAAGAVMMGTVAFIPTYVQGVMGRSALVAGFALSAVSLGWPLGTVVATRIMLRFSYRLAAALGGLFVVFGGLVMIGLEPSRGPLWAGAGAFLTGLGIGISSNAFIVAIQASVAWAERGAATASVVFTRTIGQAVGAAVFGGILNAGTAAALPAGGGDAASRVMDETLRATLPVAELARLLATIARALHDVYLISGVLALAVLLAALCLPAGSNPLRPPPAAGED